MQHMAANSKPANRLHSTQRTHTHTQFAFKVIKNWNENRCTRQNCTPWEKKDKMRNSKTVINEATNAIKRTNLNGPRTKTPTKEPAKLKLKSQQKMTRFQTHQYFHTGKMEWIGFIVNLMEILQITLNSFENNKRCVIEYHARYGQVKSLFLTQYAIVGWVMAGRYDGNELCHGLVAVMPVQCTLYTNPNILKMYYHGLGL